MSVPLSDFDRFDLNFKSDEACIGIGTMFRDENRVSLLLTPFMNWGFGENRLVLFDDLSDNDSKEVASVLIFFK